MLALTQVPEGLRSSAEPRPVSDSVPPPSASRVRGLHAEDSGRSTLVPQGTTSLLQSAVVPYITVTHFADGGS